MVKKSINIIAIILTIGASFLLDFGLPNVPVSLLNNHIDSYHQMSGCTFHPVYIKLINNHLFTFVTFLLALFSLLRIHPDSSVVLKCISLLGVVAIAGLDSIILLNILIFNLIFLIISGPIQKGPKAGDPVLSTTIRGTTPIKNYHAPFRQKKSSDILNLNGHNESEGFENATLRTIILSLILLGITFYSGETSFIWIAVAVFINREKLNYRQAAILLAPVTAYLLFMPEAPITPKLPPGAHIVPDDGVAGLLRPLFGPSAPDFQLCDRALFKTNYFGVSTIFLISFSLISILSRQIPLGMFVLAIITSADVILPESLAHIMPVATLQRLIPGYFFLPISLHLFSLLVIRASCLMVHKAEALVLSSCILILAILSPTPKIISQNKRHHISQFPTASQTPVIAGLDYVKPLGEGRKYTIVKHPLEVECSNPVNCKFVADRNRSRRWYTRGQYGTEYIKLTSSLTQKVAGVRLYQDEFFSDFPRKVQVIDCGSNVTIVPPYNWLGSLYRTTKGEVYFSSQANTVNIVLFKVPVITNCIEIKQVGYDPVHDWSITEIELFK